MVSRAVRGRIDESGKVLLPIIVIASDGLEIEVEALINLEFCGALVIPEELAGSLGWRCLGARRVAVGVEIRLMHHYLGMMAIGGDPRNVVVLGGIKPQAIIGQKLMSGRKLTVDFSLGQVLLE
ncbi:MAG TPA: hypothetical protein V6D17_07835 [Candidatus Obscuribacterales bacterium]